MQLTMSTPKSIKDLVMLIIPKKVSIKTIAKKDKPILTALKFSNLNPLAGKEVVFQNTVYKVKRIDAMNEVVFQLINVKYNNIEITLPFKNKA